MKWYEVYGRYAGALVAAETKERALELAREANDSMTLADEVKLPGEPTVEGIYHSYEE